MSGAWCIVIIAGVWFMGSVVIFTVLDAKLDRDAASLSPYEVGYTSQTYLLMAIFWPAGILGSPLWGLGKLVAWVTRKIISALDSYSTTK